MLTSKNVFSTIYFTTDVYLKIYISKTSCTIDQISNPKSKRGSILGKKNFDINILGFLFDIFVV